MLLSLSSKLSLWRAVRVARPHLYYIIKKPLNYFNENKSNFLIDKKLNQHQENNNKRNYFQHLFSLFVFTIGSLTIAQCEEKLKIKNLLNAVHSNSIKEIE
jgi:hypothetical protein